MSLRQPLKSTRRGWKARRTLLMFPASTTGMLERRQPSGTPRRLDYRQQAVQRSADIAPRFGEGFQQLALIRKMVAV